MPGSLSSEAYARSYTNNRVNHSREYALDENEFERLLEATYEMDDYFGIEARFIILVAGRLGLRAGEICHINESWIDYRRRMIIIPRYQDCDNGRDGDICGSCKQSARQMVAHNDDLDMEEALEQRWQPKTASAAREVPFDADPRAEMIVEEYIDRFGEFQSSQTGINRRVSDAASRAREINEEDVTPHGLRATAASHFASRGLDVIALQSMFGWAQLSTAHHYIRRSGENTARAIRDIQV